MMFYTNRIANSAEDGAELGGSANDWNKAAMNTAVEGMKIVMKNVLNQDVSELPDEPKLLFCKPQSESKLASIMMGLVKDVNPTDTSTTLPTSDDIVTKLKPLADLLWNEECNVYLLESNVSLKL